MLARLLADHLLIKYRMTTKMHRPPLINFIHKTVQIIYKKLHAMTILLYLKHNKLNWHKR